MVSVHYSNGRTKTGVRYAYIRPAAFCHNRSIRVAADKIEEAVQKHFQQVFLYSVGGLTIGAKNQEAALKKYWRVCRRENIGKKVQVTKL